ncbi:hypothetical protein O0Q50_22355 [Priestia aryabhattai]|uniref:CXXC-20-CXXC protein n=1 Tax=Priestia aryabhattai TaxID=412384 RepID=A0AAX6NDW5_PRIAR|nr:TIGR04104 family putative zinc finger protein [Priestia aryabhattai]MDU9693926.1 hypothetical protein [Priestia aryabhattai]NGY88778.1 hypothetical protein [Priestia megaterium]
MAQCNNCKHSWSWSYSFKKLFTFKDEVHCPSCQSAQYVSKQARNHMSMVAMIPMFICFILIAFSVTTAIIITVEIIGYALVILVLPFFYKLSNEKEYFF